MRKNYRFYIIDENGEMRCTAMYYCTEEERIEYFSNYRISVQSTYPGSHAGWIEKKK